MVSSSRCERINKLRREAISSKARPTSPSIPAIVAEKCANCHVEGDIAPFPHDRSLSDSQREMLLTWIDEDAPEGDPSEAAALPEPPEPWVPDAMI